MHFKNKTAFDREYEVVSQEIEELITEKESFILFAEQVKQLPTTNRSNNLRTGTCVRDLKTGFAPDAIKKAYEQTVMEVPHYEEMYNEGLHENMAQELGDDLLTAIERSSHLRPPLKRSLITAAISAAERRTTFETKLTKEQLYLKRFSTELCDICESLNSISDEPFSQLEFTTLRLTHDQLTRLFDRCEVLSSDRQQQIQSRNGGSYLTDNGDIERYLYFECEYTYPILHTIAELCESIQDAILATERLICTSSSESSYSPT